MSKSVTFSATVVSSDVSISHVHIPCSYEDGHPGDVSVPVSPDREVIPVQATSVHNKLLLVRYCYHYYCLFFVVIISSIIM